MAKHSSALRKWVQSPAWFWAFIIALSICIAVYLLNTLLSEAHPYTIWGIGYGIAATLLMVGAAMWAVRRRTMSIAPSRSQNWVQFHVYGGTLFFLLVLMHTGFHIPSGTLAWCLVGLTTLVALSGIVGVILQKTIPRILTSGLSIEVHFQRIPELIQEVQKKSEELVQTCPDSVRDFFKKELAGSFSGPQFRPIYFIDITGGIQSRMKQFDYLRRFLSPEEKEKLGQLQALYKSKLEMDAHYTLQKILKIWLFFHIPVSLILLILVGLHLYAVLFY